MKYVKVKKNIYIHILICVDIFLTILTSVFLLIKIIAFQKIIFKRELKKVILYIKVSRVQFLQSIDIIILDYSVLFVLCHSLSVLYHIRVYSMWYIQYASLLVLSISRREETFPLAQHFHPDHHDPDDRVPLTVRRVFSFFLSFCLLVSIQPGEKLFRPGTSNFSIRANNTVEIALGHDLRRFQFARERGTERSKRRRAGSSGGTEWEGPRREHMDGKGNGEGNKKERRPRKQVSWRIRRPTAGRRPRSLTQILQTTKHRPSSARFTIQSSSVARRSSSSWLSSRPSTTDLLLLHLRAGSIAASGRFWQARPAHRDPRHAWRRRRRELEQEKREKERSGESKRERKRNRCKDSYRENPMTRCLRDMTLFKVATGGFAFALISRDGSFSRGIVLGQVLSWCWVVRLWLALGKLNVVVSSYHNISTWHL